MRECSPFVSAMPEPPAAASARISSRKLRLTDVIDLGGKIQSLQRHAQQELQPSHDAVASANAYTSLGQVQLETADAIRRGRVGRSLEKAKRLQLRMWPRCVRAELARVHVLDHPLAKRADISILIRSACLGRGLMTPRSSRQDDPHAIDDLDPGCRARGRAYPRSGLSRSDLVVCWACSVAWR